MKILVVDSNYLAHRARFTTGGLSYNGEPTGVIYGFLNQVFSLGKKIRPDEVAFIWDSRKSLRRKRYPFYKNRTRDEGPDEDMLEAFGQFARLRREILPAIGFVNNFIQTGYEADDIIAKLVMEGPPEEYVTASSDADLFQLLDHMTMLSVPAARNKPEKIWTRSSFMKQYRIEPTDWVRVKQIAGCTSDCIPGIYGVGDATAVKYLRGNLKPDSKKYQAIAGGNAVIKRNEWLVKLPLPGTRLPVVKRSKFSSELLRMVAKRLGFKSLAKDRNRLDEWDAFYAK